MPFACAKAVCATFCAPIAGALIPIFGPDFPSQCTSPDAPEHGRMQIDQMTIAESVREADMFRRMYANAASAAANNQLPPLHQHQHQQQQQTHSQMHHYSHGPALLSPASIPSPRLNRRALPRYSGSPHDYERERPAFEGRMRFKRGPESPYMTDSEPDMHGGGGGGGGGPEMHHALAARSGMMYSPLSPPRSSGNNGGWSVVATNNHPHQHQQHTHTQHAQQQQQHQQHASSSPVSAYHPSAYREPHDLSFPSASDPILSAIPRFSRSGHPPRLEHQHQQHHLLSQRQQHTHMPHHLPSRLPSIPALSTWSWSSPHHVSSSSKRPVAEILEVAAAGGGDYEEYSDKSSPTTTVTTNTSLSRGEECGGGGGGGGAAAQQPGAGVLLAASTAASASGTDKNAALLLMHLSVRDHKDVRDLRRDGERLSGGGDRFYGVRGCGPESMSMSPVSGPGGQDGHRSKRQRATSM